MSRASLPGAPVRVGLCLAALIALAPGGLEAQAGRSEVREGNALYQDGRYREAHEKYLEGIASAPESPVIRFNDGNALYRSEDYQRALEAYQQAIESGDTRLASAAWYNLGNALYRQRQLEPSLEAYKQALRLSPGDSDAKHNLERVLQELQQQEQQEQQQQDQDDQDPQQDQQDQDQRGDAEEDPGVQPQEPQQDEPRDGDASAEPERRPGRMTPEEARRLLEAVQEDPKEVDRPRAQATGRRPRRPW